MPDRREQRARRAGPAFTLVELVVVVSIIAVLAAIAVPRLTNGSQKAIASGVQASLASVRKAIDVYFAEHGRFPGHDGGGNPDGDSFVQQLLQYTDNQGNVSSKHTSTYLFGPYLSKPFPINPLNESSKVYVKKYPGEANPSDDDVGWIAVLSTGEFFLKATDAEAKEIGAKLGQAEGTALLIKGG